MARRSKQMKEYVEKVQLKLDHALIELASKQHDVMVAEAQVKALEAALELAAPDKETPRV